jgi:DNA-binding CsgD family transcriptional regulator
VAACFAEALMVSGEEEPARLLLDHVIDQAAARGHTVALVRALAVASELDLHRGHVAAARVLAERAVEAAAEDRLDHCVVKALAARAAVLAVLGDPACVPTAEAVLRGAAGALDRWSEVRAYDALGRHALGGGDAAAAVAAFEQVERAVPSGAHAGLLRWRPDLVEAYVRLERHADACSVQERLERQAALAPTAWTGAAIARGRALLAERAAADELFADASALAVQVSQLDAARVELERGGALRRSGRRSRARTHLQVAAATFGRLGAASWAARADDDLRACGVAPREARVPVVAQLTPRELEVAMLAAAGETNREIGARLYMSAKTVEVHLGRVYRKLGVRSRTELARVDALGEADPLRDLSTI